MVSWYVNTDLGNDQKKQLKDSVEDQSIVIQKQREGKRLDKIVNSTKKCCKVQVRCEFSLHLRSLQRWTAMASILPGMGHEDLKATCGRRFVKTSCCSKLCVWDNAWSKALMGSL